MTNTFDGIVVAKYRGLSASELLAAPPDALRGVSGNDAGRLAEAFGIESIRELASCPYFKRALAISSAAGTPAFDNGPTADWAAFFARAPLDFYLQHPANRFRLEFGPVFFRGRTDGTARVVVVGQDPSTNEILAHRIFVGRSGQRVQHLLAKLGLTRSYVMLNAFLFSVYGQFNAQLEAISLEPQILAYRNEFLDRLVDRSPVEAVITFGRGARHAVENWPGAGQVPVFHVSHPAASDDLVIETWNTGLQDLLNVVKPDDGGVQDPTPYTSPLDQADMAAIPEHDLPFGVPGWHRERGGHSTRDGATKIVWTAG